MRIEQDGGQIVAKFWFKDARCKAVESLAFVEANHFNGPLNDGADASDRQAVAFTRDRDHPTID
ncbi:hypothetical protein JCM18382A_09540 [Bradyrhizobium sp. 17-4]